MLTAQLQATQPGAGGPITISNCGGTATTATDDANLVTVGIGITTTSVAPVTFASLAHFQECDINDAYADVATQQLLVTTQAGVVYGKTDVYRASKVQRLDSNFVAARYIWACVFATGTPSGTDAVQAVSQPLHLI